jgi:hypothetical protein
MSEKPISPLRQRMIEDMTVRNFVEKTRNHYIRHVKAFTTFLGRSPDTATAEDLRCFQLHQTKTGVRAADHRWLGSSAAVLLQRERIPAVQQKTKALRRAAHTAPSPTISKAPRTLGRNCEGLTRRTCNSESRAAAPPAMSRNEARADQGAEPIRRHGKNEGPGDGHALEREHRQ